MTDGPETANTPPSPAAPRAGEPLWERALIEKLALSAVTEQRRARRWGIFFKSLLVVYLLAIFYVYLPADMAGFTSAPERHSALVELSGVIMDGSDADADTVVTGLRDAFEDPATEGVILRINSPGGSPVQSHYIYQEMQRLRKKYPKIPLYAVVTDICASGGYFAASAADKIYADETSMVGSIGVLMNGFGFVETLDKLGIERRLLTAGEHKGFLDPFTPTKPAEVAHIEKLLGTVHQAFIDAVKAGRGERLKTDQPDLFSGLIWTGQQALELGLIDDFASAGEVAREVIGAAEIVDFTPQPDLLRELTDRLSGGLRAAVQDVLTPLLH